MTNSSAFKSDEAAKLEIVLTLVRNVRLLKAALETKSPGLIYFFEEYALGVAIDGDKSAACAACAADRATVFPLSERNARRVITNGHGHKATLMTRDAALRIAIAQGEKSLFDLSERFDETK